MLLDATTVKVKKAEVLSHLRENLTKHKKIVQEAREGYLTAAMDALKERMKQLKTGKLVTLSFHLAPPQDHREEYLTAIRMFEMSVDEEIELTGQQVECLIRDRWHWKRAFLFSNSLYSAGAKEEINELEDDALAEMAGD